MQTHQNIKVPQHLKIFVILPYFPANKPTRQISRGQFLAMQMRVFACYRRISQI